ncbi:MAG: Maf family protein [Candidatus Binatia bacterium]
MGATLVLASASPRRQELLARLGIVCDVVPSTLPERPRPHESPDVFVRRAAREKAADVARRRPDAFVLGADTVVAVGGVILGKPADRADARRILQLLSGRTHRVLTAVALVDPVRRLVDEVVAESVVTFHDLSAEAIDRYVASREPYDKAGAYAVQGGAKRFVVELRGSYSNVMGLPVDEVRALLRRRLPAESGRPV